MRRLIALLLALVLAFGLVACGNGNNQEPAGDNQQNQTQQPEDGQNGELDTEEGQEPQIPDGEDITGTDTDPADDGGNTAVDGGNTQEPAGQPQEPAGESMKLSRSDFTLFAAGNTYRLTVSGVEGTSTFSSSDETVATVAKDGTVTAVAPGTATITVTNGDQKATCTVRCNWKEEEKPEEPEEPASDSVDLQAFYDSMVSKYSFQTLQNFTGDVLDSYYPGMSGVSTKQCLIMGTMLSMNNGEFCLVEVSDSKDVDTVKDIFQARIDQMAGGGAWYPEPTEQWTNNSRVASNGNYVMMVVHENCDDIVAAFNDYTK